VNAVKSLCVARPRGFTLIEVVIALALSALIMFGLVSALAGMGNIASRLDERGGQTDRQWLAGGFLRETLVTALGQYKYKLPDGGESVYFSGTSQFMEWVGNMPARHGAGGIHHFRLLLREAESGEAPWLEIQYAPYAPESADLAPEAVAAAHVLAAEVRGFAIAYQSKPVRTDEEAVWSDVWDDPERLPGRVRILIETRDSAWPPLVATIGAVDGATRGSAAPGWGSTFNRGRR
jgi:general secretion pathway protein J